jgi:hypothetical protein
MELRAANIRNVRSPDRTYPSEIQLTATLLDSAPLRVDGRADFLAEPFAAFDVHVDLKGLELDYLKPLFQDVDVYDPEQDKNKPLTKKVYEGIVGGVGTLLRNRSEDAVATRTEISGTLQSPNTSTWQAVLGVLQNAFFQSILPGLERQRQR